MKRFTLIIFLFAFTNLLFSQSNVQLNVQEFTLENGLRVILNEDQSVGTVFGAVVVCAGSKQDPPEATGIAHYLEHMLFKGTTELGTVDYEKEKPYLDSINMFYDELALVDSVEEKAKIQKKINELSVEAAKYGLPNEFEKVLSDMGSTAINAFTSKDYTVYQNVFPPQQIIKWLDLYSHRFLNPVFRNFQSELEVVYEEKNMAMDNELSWFYDDLQLLLFGKNGYGSQSTLGTVEHLKSPSLTKMYEFFNTYYVANNMALILTGNFDSRLIKPIIEEKFGRLPKRELPKLHYNRILFSGRQTKTSRALSYEAFAMGFKVLPDNLQEKAAVSVGLNILQNGSQTGILQDLEDKSNVDWLTIIPLIFKDDGAVTFSYTPNKTNRKIESKILNGIKAIKKGSFDDDLLAVARNEFALGVIVSLEDQSGRMDSFIDAVVNEVSWETYASYLNSLSNISKGVVQQTFEKFFNEDYLAIHFKARYGALPKPDLEKPSHAAVKSEQEGSSKYSNYIASLKELQIAPKFVSFSKDLEVKHLSGGNYLFKTPNPVNDVFSMEVRYHIGEHHVKHLPITSRLINYCGTKERSKDELKIALAKLGGWFTLESSLNYLRVHIWGFEKNAAEILRLVDELLRSPKGDRNSFDLMLRDISLARNEEVYGAANQNSLLQQYGIYGEYSPYISRKSLIFIAEKKNKIILDSLQQVFNYAASIHYTGNLSLDETAKLILKNYRLNNTEQKQQQRIKLGVTLDSNSVLYLPVANALQSHILFYIPGEVVELEDYPIVDAFNAYFGSSFTGLVFQEIREYRSLSYSAYGHYSKPDIPGYEGMLVLAASCQVDKTVEAIEVMYGLIHDLPKYSSRMENIKDYLWNESFTNYPSFRTMSQTIESYAKMGYKGDPNQLALSKYAKMTFDEMMAFYNKQVANKPFRLMVTAPYSEELKTVLEKYGSVRRLSPYQLRIF